MIGTTIPVTVNLQEGLKRIRVEPLLMTGDNQAHTFAVKVEPAGTLNGATVTASLVRGDGVTVAMNGSANGDTATVTLDASCYAVVGRATLTITAAAGGAVVSLLYAELNVLNSSTDTAADPAHIIPSITEIAQAMINVTAATASANEAATAAATAATDASGAAEAASTAADAAGRQAARVESAIQSGIATIPLADETDAGLMSAADKVKLDGVKKATYYGLNVVYSGTLSSGNEDSVTATITIPNGADVKITGFTFINTSGERCRAVGEPSVAVNGTSATFLLKTKNYSSSGAIPNVYFSYVVLEG